MFRFAWATTTPLGLHLHQFSFHELSSLDEVMDGWRELKADLRPCVRDAFLSRLDLGGNDATLHETPVVVLLLERLTPDRMEAMSYTHGLC